MTTKSDMLRLIEQRGALKDSELARLLGVAHQQVNQAARGLAAAGAISRARGPDGVIRNHLRAAGATPQGFQEQSRRGGVSPSPRAWPVLGCVVAETPVAREDLTRLGFVEHHRRRSPTLTSPKAV
jgi:DNA-binding transcriptional regulator YdaS (Cro superfamily)